MTCDGCKWWSEMIAASDGDGIVKACCLNEHSLWYGKFAYVGCNDREPGKPIDAELNRRLDEIEAQRIHASYEEQP